MNQLGKQYTKRGLVTLAVNTGESKAKYNDYVGSHKYTYLAWVWDSTGEITNQYKVRGLPTTYVLDREGVIRYVHVGYGEGLVQTFAREVETLLE